MYRKTVTATNLQLNGGRETRKDDVTRATYRAGETVFLVGGRPIENPLRSWSHGPVCQPDQKLIIYWDEKRRSRQFSFKIQSRKASDADPDELFYGSGSGNSPYGSKSGSEEKTSSLNFPPLKFKFSNFCEIKGTGTGMLLHMRLAKVAWGWLRWQEVG